MTVIDSTILARSRWPGQVLRPARTWVMHDMEAPERGTIAEDVGRYFQTTTRTASTHFGVDNNSVVRYAYDGDKVAAAYGLNSDSLHVEHAGYARQIRSEWLDPYGVQMLDLSAQLFVEVGYKQHGIPATLLTPKQTADRQTRGVTSHVNSTIGWGVSGGHTDPGDNFPWDYWLERVRLHIVGGAGTPMIVVPDPVLKRPMRGEEVSEWQKQLNQVLFYKLGTGGRFGKKTHAATLIFQRDAKIAQDGIVGPITRAKMKEYIDQGKKVQFKLGPIKIKKTPAVAEDVYPGTPVKLGDHGSDVRKVQQWIKDRKYTIAVDGWFGPQTQDRVMRWQKSNGIKDHGRVNKRTWRSLARTSAK